jgi:hypothetical protein
MIQRLHLFSQINKLMSMLRTSTMVSKQVNAGKELDWTALHVAAQEVHESVIAKACREQES